MKSYFAIYLFIFILSFTPSLVLSVEMKTELEAGSRYLSNAYYEDVSGTGDFIMDVKPRLLVGEFDDERGSYADLAARYSKYTSEDALDNYGFDLEGQARLLNTDSTSLWLSGYAKNESEAAVDSESLVRYRVIYGGDGKVEWKIGDYSRFSMGGNYEMQTHDAEIYQHLDGYNASGNMRYSYFFLPETAIFVEGSSGIRVYPNGLSPADDVEFDEQFDSVFVEGMSGVEGRLSDTTSMHAAAGFLIRIYDDDIDDGDFAEPIFRLKFEEQLSPRDILVASFDYIVTDSYYTNFMVNQTISLGYGRILGDQVLALAKGAYSSLSFSKPNRREDQRLYGEVEIEYSYNPQTKFSGVFQMDILNSDARENFTSTGTFDDVPDPGASYEAFTLGASAKYIF